MAEKPRYRALASIDPQELAEFQAGIRKRYTDEQIVAEIVACAERLGRSPTMREFAADAETAVHPADGDRALRLVERREARRRASFRAASRRARSCSASCARSARSSAGRRPRATSTSTRAGFPRSRSTGTHSARLRMRCARPGSTCRWGRRGSSGPSTRGSRSPSGSGGCRSSPTGPRRGARTTRS